jgi:tetraacyldisaccharide 4'-kinase
LKKYFVRWLEEYLFFPSPFQQIIGVLFLPFTVLYCVITAYSRVSKKPIEFGIPVISIGNLLLGGTGKTPVTIALAQRYKKTAIVLRGYKRKSKGLYVIGDGKKVLEDLDTSGDEAFLYAKTLPKTIVIVSEDRKYGVLKAKELGAEIVFLDDGYRHHDIKKFDILLRPKKEPTNIFCLPSGGYRDTKMMYSFADMVLHEEKEFQRKVRFLKNNTLVEQLPTKLVLVTAIAKADRLLEYLPKDIKTVIFEDHYSFVKKDIEDIYKKFPDHAIVTTQKDFVKLEQFKIENLYLMDLTIEIDKKCCEKIDHYIKNYNDPNDQLED